MWSSPEEIAGWWCSVALLLRIVKSRWSWSLGLIFGGSVFQSALAKTKEYTIGKESRTEGAFRGQDIRPVVGIDSSRSWIIGAEIIRSYTSPVILRRVAKVV